MSRVRPRHGLWTLLLPPLVAVAVACGGGATSPPVTYPPGAVVVKAEAIAFDRDQLNVPADEAFTLVLDNRDTDVHNVAIRTEQGTSGDIVFRHDPIGKQVGIFEVPAIAPGTYYFLCEVHPQMTGTVVAQ